MKILLVEDNELNRKVMNAFLRHLGHEARIAIDGESALDLMTDEHFDVVLSDVQLPGISGMDLAVKVRQGKEPAPFMVAVTAMARSDGDAYYSRHGFDSYISKPISLDALREVLRAAESHRQ